MKLVFDQVGFAYEDRPSNADASYVFRNISFAVDQDEIVAIVGASGVGKSTLLRLACGLEIANEGRILHDQELVQSPSQKRGIVFQHYGMFEWLTVSGNVEFAAQLAGETSPEATQEAQELLEKVGLWHDRNKFPADLSGGMRQRLALVRALVAKPALLCLDEPFSALDPITKEGVRALTIDLATKRKTSLLLVSHDIQAALSTADRCLVIAGSPATVAMEVDGFRQKQQGVERDRAILSVQADILEHMRT